MCRVIASPARATKGARTLAGEQVHGDDEPGPPRPARRRPFPGRRRLRGGHRSALTMRRIITVLVIEVAALGCVITCVAALIGNNISLAFLAGVVGCLLILAAWILSRPRPDGGNRAPASTVKTGAGNRASHCGRVLRMGRLAGRRSARSAH